MGQSVSKAELREWADKLKILKEKQPNSYYEFKGRVNALYEKETEIKPIGN